MFSLINLLYLPDIFVPTTIKNGTTKCKKDKCWRKENVGEREPLDASGGNVSVYRQAGGMFSG